MSHPLLSESPDKIIRFIVMIKYLRKAERFDLFICYFKFLAEAVIRRKYSGIPYQNEIPKNMLMFDGLMVKILQVCIRDGLCCSRLRSCCEFLFEFVHTRIIPVLSHLFFTLLPKFYLFCQDFIFYLIFRFVVFLLI